MTQTLLLLPGDGIGPEIMEEVKKILAWFNARGGTQFETETDLVGGAAYDAHGQAISDAAMDKAMKQFGFPVGPIQLGDEVGIDVANKVVGNLIGEQPKFLGVRMEGADLGMLKAFVDKGLLGRKAGAGFYDYSVKEKKKPINKAALDVIAQFRDASNSSAEGLGLDELNERLMLRFVKEAVHCLESGVIETAREGDIGAVFP